MLIQSCFRGGSVVPPVAAARLLVIALGTASAVARAQSDPAPDPSITSGEAAKSGESRAVPGSAVAPDRPSRGFTLRIVAERTYGQWKRDYEGSYLAPGAAAEFGVRRSETLDGWRGRVFVGEARRDGGPTGGLSFSAESADEIRHEVLIAGVAHSFASKPWVFGGACRGEFQFLERAAVVGVEIGVSSIHESVRSVDQLLTVVPLSNRFGVTWALQFGYRLRVWEQLVLGAAGSAEYHFFTNSFRLGLGITLEIDPTR